MLAQGLVRHEERRRHGIPTVSVLAGTASVTAAAWLGWLTGQGRHSTDVASTPTATALTQAWLDGLASRRELPEDLARALVAEAPDALAPGGSVDALRRMLVAARPAERERLLDAFRMHGASEGTVALCRHVLARMQPAARADAAAPEPWMVAALCDLLDEHAIPGLYLWVSAGASARFVQALTAACELVATAPRLPVAVATEAETVRLYLRHAAESRVKAAAREGVLGLIDADDTSADDDAVARFLDTARAAPVRRAERPGTAPPAEPAEPDDEAVQRLLASATERPAHGDDAWLDPDARPEQAPGARSRAFLIERRVPGELFGELDRAVAALQRARSQPVAPDSTEVHEDAARSAAERLLYRTLEVLPQSAGLFALGRRLGIAFGPAPMEVDLLCEPLRIAVEIDGTWHVRGADAYRRDRTKDVLLQLEGYLIVRCLADDVVDALGSVLGTILDAIAAQRARVR